MSAPLLRCRGACIEVDGEVLLDELAVDADGARVVLVGDWEPLFRLWSRHATLRRGSVEVLGASAETALRDNRLGIAVADSPQFQSWKTIESLTESARLLGLGRRAAARRAEATLDRLGLVTLAKRRTATLDRAERCALSIARAVLGDPPAIAIERPFERLDDGRAPMVESVLALASNGRQLLLHLEAPASSGPESRALETADRVVGLRAGALADPSAPFPSP